MSVFILYTDRDHPVTGKPINGMVAEVSSDRTHHYIFDTDKPTEQYIGTWEKVPKFQASAQVVSLSFKNGMGSNLQEAADNLDKANNTDLFRHGKPFMQHQTHSYIRAQQITKEFNEWVRANRVPPLPI